MMSNVRMSSQNAGSTRKVADTHKRELKVGKKGELYREHKQHFVDITWEDIEKQFKKQNGRCYYLPNYKIGIIHLAAGIWKDGKDMRVDKSIKIELETLDNKKINKSLRFDI